MIYIHIPFCRSFCTYCDFYSEVAARCRKAEDERKQTSLFTGFGKAVAAEIKARKDEVSDEVNTLYIGGGTPSVLPLSVYETILDALRDSGHGGPYQEFTVEVNPDDIVANGETYIEGLLKLGVNRISMGVQSFDDGILRFMNRRHDAATARKAYAMLEDAGVGNISIDLIFGLPQLSDRQWRETLKQALEISPKGRLPQHISSYQLSVEPGSALAGMVEKGLCPRPRKNFARGSTACCAMHWRRRDTTIMKSRISPFRDMKQSTIPLTGAMCRMSVSDQGRTASVEDRYMVRKCA